MFKGKIKRIKYTALLLAPTALLAVPVYLIATPLEKASDGVKKLVHKIKQKQIEKQYQQYSKQKLEEIEQKYKNTPIGKIERTFNTTENQKSRITTVHTKYGPLEKQENIYLNNSSDQKRAVIYSGFVCIEKDELPVHITATKIFCTQEFSTNSTKDYVLYNSQVQKLWQSEPFEFEQSSSPTCIAAKHFNDFAKYFDEQYFKAKENLPII